MRGWMWPLGRIVKKWERRCIEAEWRRLTWRRWRRGDGNGLGWLVLNWGQMSERWSERSGAAAR